MRRESRSARRDFIVIEAEKNIEKEEVAIEGKKIATKTISVIAGKQTFKLFEGQEVPNGISQKTLESLINSNLIK